MKNAYIIALSLFFLSFINNGFSQEVVFKQNLKLPKGCESLVVHNDTKSIICLLTFKSQEVTVLKLNDRFEVQKEISVPRSKFPDEQLLGHIVKENEIILFFRYFKRLQTVVIEFDNQRALHYYTDIDFSRDKMLEGYSYDTYFNVLTVNRRNSAIDVYRFKNEVDFDVISFKIDEYRSNQTLFADLNKVSYDKPTISVIHPTTPQSLSDTNSQKKAYYQKDKIILTVDLDHHFTSIIELDLKEKTSKYKEVAKLEMAKAYNYISNSLIVGDTIFQVAASNNELKIGIRDLTNDTLIKSYSVGKNDTIDFKNTPFHFEVNGLSNVDKELPSTQKFLNKIIINSNLAIAVNKWENSSLEATIGAYVEKDIVSPPVSFAPIGLANIATPQGMMFIAASIAPAYASYQAGKYVKTIHFKTILESKNLEHIPGKAPKNKFEKVKEFEERHESKHNAITMFNIDSVLYYCYYDKTDKNYYIVKF